MDRHFAQRTIKCSGEAGISAASKRPVGGNDKAARAAIAAATPTAASCGAVSRGGKTTVAAATIPTAASDASSREAGNGRASAFATIDAAASGPANAKPADHPARGCPPGQTATPNGCK
jgi:hypothetical protein